MVRIDDCILYPYHIFIGMNMTQQSGVVPAAQTR